MKRSANAVWKGGLKDGTGVMSTGSKALHEHHYHFSSRFEESPGTNPEELIAAALAGCFSMAFSVGLERAGATPRNIRTSAAVKLEKVSDAFSITSIDLTTEADVSGIDDAKFHEVAEATKKNCPVSKALAAVGNITLNAKLVSG